MWARERERDGESWMKILFPLIFLFYSTTLGRPVELNGNGNLRRDVFSSFLSSLPHTHTLKRKMVKLAKHFESSWESNEPNENEKSYAVCCLLCCCTIFEWNSDEKCTKHSTIPRIDRCLDKQKRLGSMQFSLLRSVRSCSCWTHKLWQKHTQTHMRATIRFPSFILRIQHSANGICLPLGGLFTSIMALAFRIYYALRVFYTDEHRSAMCLCRLNQLLFLLLQHFLPFIISASLKGTERMQMEKGRE